MFALSCAGMCAQTVADAHFHHLHLNATDPKADIEFYTTKFDAEKASFKGLIDAVVGAEKLDAVSESGRLTAQRSGEHHLAFRVGRGSYEGDGSEAARLRHQVRHTYHRH
jgi:hypothetical protein